MNKSKKNYNIHNDCRGMCEQEIFETIVKDRKIVDIEHFLNPTIEDLIPYECLKRIDEAEKLLENAIDKNLHVGILWDTDTDGVSSGAIMTRYLKHFTDNVTPFINEGKAHGLIGQDLERFKEIDLLIIVDSLDKNTTQYEKLWDKGTELIILDHHDIDRSVDYDTYAVLVSSQRDYANPHLSGSGVVWKFCKYLDECMMCEYADEYTDLAACGLVADMVDVSENSMENRYIIYQGLKEKINPAIKKIIGSFSFNSKAIAFSIAPLINAANRMSKNESAVNAFFADENKEVLKYVKELRQCKEEQNVKVNSLMDDIIAQADTQIDKKVISMMINSDADIAGLLGNKLLEKYQRPLLILRDKKESYGGSARAIGIDDFRKMCSNTGMCEANGHPLAFGINIPKKCYEMFITAIEDELSDIEFEVNTDIDIEIELGDLSRELIDKIKQLDFVSGTGFKPIIVKIADITEYEIGNMSQGKHLVVKPNNYTNLIYWNWNGSFDEMEDNAMLEEPITVIGNVDSGFIGRNFSLQVIMSELGVT